MKENRTIEAILDWNPWLVGEFPEELLGYRREVNILDYLKYKEIKILEGPRRSGKSTLLYRVLHKLHSENKKVLYLNFDDEVLRGRPLEEVFNEFLQRRDVDYLFVDEIQNCSNWVPFVRKKYDTKTLKQIWITGSNSNLIKEEYANYLTGRNIKLKILPLGFGEYLRFQNIKYDLNLLSVKDKITIKRAFDEFVEYGGFPEVALRKIGRKELLLNYYEDFLYKDIVSRYGADAQKLRALSTFLNSNATKKMSYRKMSRMLDLNYATTTKYLSYLLEVYLFFILPKFDFSVKKQISDERKIFALDTGIVNAVSFKFSRDRGRQLENVVFLELKRRERSVYFHKEKNECDFLLCEEGRIVGAIQVTQTMLEEKVRKRELAGLTEAMEKFDLSEGLILTDDESREIVSGRKKITVMPVWEWLLRK